MVIGSTMLMLGILALLGATGSDAFSREDPGARVVAVLVLTTALVAAICKSVATLASLDLTAVRIVGVTTYKTVIGGTAQAFIVEPAW